MHQRTCPQDGYPMTWESHGLGTTEGEWTCACPWHPRDPGCCPQCSTERPKASGIGTNPEAECRRCGHFWMPFPAK